MPAMVRRAGPLSSVPVRRRSPGPTLCVDMRVFACLLLLVAALAVAPAAAPAQGGTARPAVVTVAAAHPPAAAPGSGRAIGRLIRLIVRSGLPPVVFYSLLGAAVLGFAGYRYRTGRRGPRPGRGTGPSGRYDDALAAKLRRRRDE
jgi:hypothetical protein